MRIVKGTREACKRAYGQMGKEGLAVSLGAFTAYLSLHMGDQDEYLPAIP